MPGEFGVFRTLPRWRLPFFNTPPCLSQPRSFCLGTGPLGPPPRLVLKLLQLNLYLQKDSNLTLNQGAQRRLLLAVPLQFD
jgi:hypothetical protein